MFFPKRMRRTGHQSINFLKSQIRRTITATTIIIPTQTPALNIPPTTSHPVMVASKKVKIKSFVKMPLFIIRKFVSLELPEDVIVS